MDHAAATQCIHDWLYAIAKAKGNWWNDWVHLENGLWMYNENQFYEWQEHDEVFSIHTIEKKDGLYYKLLPLNIEYKEEYGYDGFFIETKKMEKKEKLIQDANIEAADCHLVSCVPNKTMFMYIVV